MNQFASSQLSWPCSRRHPRKFRRRPNASQPELRIANLIAITIEPVVADNGFPGGTGALLADIAHRTGIVIVASQPVSSLTGTFYARTGIRPGRCSCRTGVFGVWTYNGRALFDFAGRLFRHQARNRRPPDIYPLVAHSRHRPLHSQPSYSQRSGLTESLRCARIARVSQGLASMGVWLDEPILAAIIGTRVLAIDPHRWALPLQAMNPKSSWTQVSFSVHPSSSSQLISPLNPVDWHSPRLLVTGENLARGPFLLIIAVIDLVRGLAGFRPRCTSLRCKGHYPHHKQSRPEPSPRQCIARSSGRTEGQRRRAGRRSARGILRPTQGRSGIYRPHTWQR